MMLPGLFGPGKTLVCEVRGTQLSWRWTCLSALVQTGSSWRGLQSLATLDFPPKIPEITFMSCFPLPYCSHPCLQVISLLIYIPFPLSPLFFLVVLCPWELQVWLVQRSAGSAEGAGTGPLCFCVMCKFTQAVSSFIKIKAIFCKRCVMTSVFADETLTLYYWQAGSESVVQSSHQKCSLKLPGACCSSFARNLT